MNQVYSLRSLEEGGKPNGNTETQLIISPPPIFFSSLQVYCIKHVINIDVEWYSIIQLCQILEAKQSQYRTWI